MWRSFPENLKLNQSPYYASPSILGTHLQKWLRTQIISKALQTLMDPHPMHARRHLYLHGGMVQWKRFATIKCVSTQKTRYNWYRYSQFSCMDKKIAIIKTISKPFGHWANDCLSQYSGQIFRKTCMVGVQLSGSLWCASEQMWHRSLDRFPRACCTALLWHGEADMRQ